MAVRHGYGKIAGTDALVFAYDTGDTVNSYRGRPATNYGPADFASWSLESGDVKRIATGNYYKGQPTYNCRTALGTSWIAINTTISGLRTAAGASGTVTMSCMVRNNNSSAYPVYAYIGHDFGSTRTIPANSDWQKIQWTVNQSNMNNDYVEFRPYTNTAEVYLEMTMPMVEVNVGNASQFVNGTRSVSGSLLDLTGRNTVDLTNVSFDSNAQKVFDGTNDHISGVLPLQGNGAPHTIEIVMSLDVDQGLVGTRRDPFTIGNATTHQYSSLDINPSFMNWYFYSRDTTFTNSPLMVAGQYYHMVLSYAGGASNNVNKQVWYNGVKQTLSAGSSETSLLPNNPQFSLGRDIGRNTAYFPGKIPIFKVYNRALTEAEALNNYRHYKSRFNI